MSIWDFNPKILCLEETYQLEYEPKRENDYLSFQKEFHYDSGGVVQLIDRVNVDINLFFLI